MRRASDAAVRSVLGGASTVDVPGLDPAGADDGDPRRAHAERRAARPGWPRRWPRRSRRPRRRRPSCPDARCARCPGSRTRMVSVPRGRRPGPPRPPGPAGSPNHELRRLRERPALVIERGQAAIAAGGQRRPGTRRACTPRSPGSSRRGLERRPADQPAARVEDRGHALDDRRARRRCWRGLSVKASSVEALGGCTARSAAVISMSFERVKVSSAPSEPIVPDAAVRDPRAAAEERDHGAVGGGRARGDGHAHGPRAPGGDGDAGRREDGGRGHAVGLGARLQERRAPRRAPPRPGPRGRSPSAPSCRSSGSGSACCSGPACP